MKNTVINIRVSESLKEDLELVCGIKNISLSNLTRNILMDYISNGSFENDHNNHFSKETIKLFQSLSFSEFIFWIYNKRDNPSKDEDWEFYDQHLKLIDRLNKLQCLDSEILKEFNKIGNELKEDISTTEEFSTIKPEFDFPKEERVGSFNYNVLADFMYNIRFKNDEKILFID
ncbi:hypothetical protein [Mangrovimonas aestuarii]|uniref:hypothetical protein n=1 Tax=Mangrovimonas aestuarii TaxID=3018443 RepID=UPI0023799831|nr:hypothetical protein [Mangrovimonas aestuarii]